MAGNAPPNRVAQLRRFWETVTQPATQWATWFDQTVAALPGLRRQFGSAQALLFGQSGFFAPWPVTDWLWGAGQTSYYSTAALKSTLESVVDFERINAGGGPRLSVG